MMLKKDLDEMILGTKDLFLYLTEKTDGRKTKIDAFCDLLDKSSAGFVSASLKKQIAELEPCQCYVTISELATEWQWNRVAVRTFLNKLEAYGQLSIKKLTQSLILTMPLKHPEYTNEDKVQHGFYGKLQSIVAPWVLNKIDDGELLDAITRLLTEQIPILKSMYSEYLLTNVDGADAEDSSSTEEEAQRFAVDYTNQIIIEELVLATFIKVLSSKELGSGELSNQLLQQTCAHNWTEFLNNLIGLSQFILGYSSGIPEPSAKTEKLSHTYKAILANRLAEIVYENAEIK